PYSFSMAATGAAVANGGAPGGAGPYVIGPARPKAAAPGNGDLPWRAAVPLHRQGRFANAQSASRRSIPRWGKRKKGIRRAQSQTTGPAKRWLRGLAALIR